MTRIDPYVGARDLFVEWCDDIISAIPIEFGVVGCPGLSDIDIGIVFDGEVQDDFQQILSRFPEKTRELMNGGTLMFFPKDVFGQILLVDDINVKPLSGEIHIVKNTNEEQCLVDLVQIIEWLPERLTGAYREMQQEPVNIKRLIGFFYSMCYSLKKIQKYVKPSEKTNSFIEQVYSLRKEWFLLEDNIAQKRLKKIANIHFDVCAGAIKSIVPILEKHFIVSDKISINYNIHTNVSFVAEQHDFSIYTCDGNVCVTVPPVFLCSYVEYSKYDSRLGNIIKRRISYNGDSVTVSEEMRDILKRRAHIFSSLFDFVKELGCGSGLYKFGWYLNE